MTGTKTETDSDPDPDPDEEKLASNVIQADPMPDCAVFRQWIHRVMVGMIGLLMPDRVPAANPIRY